MRSHLDKEGFAPKVRKGSGLMPSRPHKTKVDKGCGCRKACRKETLE